jgi:hypothetical protein
MAFQRISERTRWLICGTLYVAGSVGLITMAWAIRWSYQAWARIPGPVRVGAPEILLGALLVLPYFRWAQRFCYGDRIDAWGRVKRDASAAEDDDGGL